MTSSHIHGFKLLPTTLAVCAAIATQQATGGTESPSVDSALPIKESSGSVSDSIHLFGTARLRYDYADFGAPGLDTANLGSLRTRFGIKTDSFHGLSFLAEAEHTWVLTDSGHYRPFPGFPPANHAVIADPDNFQLNRLQVSYQWDAISTIITVGRQAITLDDQRFIGAVGWRQNDQTYDAVRIENKSIKDLTINYVYIDQVNRIFGTNAPATALEKWDSDSHLINIAYSGIANHTLRAFAYLLEFDNSPANSSDTFGLELQGTRELSSSNNLNYLITIATQSDAGDNPTDYSEQYFRAQLGVTSDCCHYGAGAEIITSDGKGGRFRFPLGTNHKFNGFADAFLTPPAGGLRDYYAWIGTEALGFKHTLTYHHYQTENNSTNLGWELDYVAKRKLFENSNFILKVAHLDGEGTQMDVTRASAEINYSF
ncbi:MAG: alginate export family protein [Akkermansiaceae bacterium]